MKSLTKERKPSPKKKCLYCEKITEARGMYMHVKICHPEKISKPSNKPVLNGVQQRNKVQYRNPSIALQELIVMYGASWILMEIAKMNNDEKKKLFTL